MGKTPKTKTGIPRTAHGLRAWLLQANEGRAIAAEIAENFLEEKCRACQRFLLRPKVLVVLRRIGDLPGAEVYAESGVNLKFLELPDIPDDGDFAELTEQFIEVQLPKSWRQIVNLPARRIHREVYRGMSVSEALRCERELRLLRQIREAFHV